MILMWKVHYHVRTYGNEPSTAHTVLYCSMEDKLLVSVLKVSSLEEKTGAALRHLFKRKER